MFSVFYHQKSGFVKLLHPVVWRSDSDASSSCAWTIRLVMEGPSGCGVWAGTLLLWAPGDVDIRIWGLLMGSNGMLRGFCGDQVQLKVLTQQIYHDWVCLILMFL